MTLLSLRHQYKDLGKCLWSSRFVGSFAVTLYYSQVIKVCSCKEASVENSSDMVDLSSTNNTERFNRIEWKL